MIHLIRTHPDRVLRRVAPEVNAMTEEIRRLCDDMVETMAAAHGLGLAANQIGISLRIISLETGSEKESSPLVFINPRIVQLEGEEVGEEGCLSIPELLRDGEEGKKGCCQGQGSG